MTKRLMTVESVKPTNILYLVWLPGLRQQQGLVDTQCRWWSQLLQYNGNEEFGVVESMNGEKLMELNGIWKREHGEWGRGWGHIMGNIEVTV